MLSCNFSEKGLGQVSPSHFVYDYCVSTLKSLSLSNLYRYQIMYHLYNNAVTVVFIVISTINAV